MRESLFLFLFSYLASLFDIWKSDSRNLSGQERKVLYSTRATREYQKQGILLRFKLNIQKILIFGIFLDLRLFDGQNWSEQEAKLIHASRVTRGYQNLGV